LIPDLNDGVLPVGIHDCTFEEISKVFGRFDRTDIRLKLTQKLGQYIVDARNSGIASAIIVDGSYITRKAEPSDIDVILALRKDFDLGQELRPFEYNIQSKRMVRRLYGLDVLPAVEDSEAYQRYLQLFSRVRLDDPEQTKAQLNKGVLRIAI
jgi:hypothetical protein